MQTVTPKVLAQAFHEAYERLAPRFGYETRRETAVAWTELPERNRLLMLAVSEELLRTSLANCAQQDSTMTDV